MIPIVLYGCYSIKVQSHEDFFTNDGMFYYDYLQARNKYFDSNL